MNRKSGTFRFFFLVAVLGLLTVGLLTGCGEDPAVTVDGDEDQWDFDPNIETPDGDDTEDPDGDNVDIIDEVIDGDIEPSGACLEVSETINFGSVLLYTSKVKTIPLKSACKEDLTIFSTYFSAETSSEFKINNPIEDVAEVLPQDAIYNLEIEYSPRDVGKDIAILVITTNGSPNRMEVTITSNYKGETTIEVSPIEVHFDNVQVGSQGACRNIVVKNRRRPEGEDDNAVLTILGISMHDPNDSNFYLNGNYNNSVLLAPDYTTQIQICCQPQEQGELTNSLHILNDADVGEQDVEVPLTCKGVVPVLVMTPTCDMEESIDFGEVVVNSLVSKQMEITNAGSAILEVHSVSLSNDTHSAFLLNAQAINNARIEPGDSKRFELVYNPLTSGINLGVIEILSNDFDNPTKRCPLKGQGVISAMRVEPTSLDFGNVLVGEAATRTIRVLNDGNATLQVIDITSSIPPECTLIDEDLFALPVELPRGQYHDFTLDFHPTSEHCASFNVTVVTNAGDTPNLDIPAIGCGVAPHIAVTLVGEPDFEDTIDFGEVRLGDTAELILKVCNAGHADLIISDMGLGQGTSTEFRFFPEALPPIEFGQCKEISMFYNPILFPGPDTGTFHMSTNDTDEALQRLEFNLKGTGINPKITINPRTDSSRSYDFGEVLKGASSAPEIFEITNTGSGILEIASITKSFGNEENFTLTKDGEPYDFENMSVLLYPVDQQGQSFTFEIIYSPNDQISHHNLTVVVANNDYNAGEKPIYLEGTGVDCPAPWFDLDDNPADCEYYCVAWPPTPEQCNGQDDDCNGETDEIFPVDETCAGVGACPDGAWECNNTGAGVTCSTNPGGSDYQPAIEYCNGTDDDCNGEIDDNQFLYRGFPTNFDVGDPCVGLGECGIGRLECKNLFELRCSTDPGGSDYPDPPPSEFCDNRDNDCDGEVDEDWPFLGYQCSGAGACGSYPGVHECTRDGSGIICSTDPGGSQFAGGVEYCDGIDNDCNDQIDEAQFIYNGQFRNAGEACNGEGACGMGVLECDPMDPTRLICSTDPGGSEDQSVDELCDNVDNDCDGVVDNGFGIGNPCEAECMDQTNNQCDCGWGQLECDQNDPRQVDTICSTEPGGSAFVFRPETCDGRDNNCDGSVDENFHIGEVCLGQGECGLGYYECDGPTGARCNVDWGGSMYQGSAEVCDGRDNDCDGSLDEDFMIGQPCDGVGECGPGMYECNGPYNNRCSTDFGGSAYEGTLEICDSLDNDCDGSVDEDYLVGTQCDGLGECGIGTFECKNSSESRCSTEPGGTEDQSIAELCDGRDNDCDGALDEDFDVFGSDCNNCGACGRECYCGGAAGHATGICEEGVPGCICLDGYYNVNGDNDDGCECQSDGSLDAGNVCSQARQTSPFNLPDSGSTARASGALVPLDDVDWYTFYASDTTDTSCDNFHIRVRFTPNGNPGLQYRFALLRSNCNETGNNVLCLEGTDFTYATDFSNTGPTCSRVSPGSPDGSSHYGECPCYAPGSSCPASSSLHSGSVNNPCCSSSNGGINQCTDNSSTFYVKVFRAASAVPSCEPFEIEITNGVFSSN